MRLTSKPFVVLDIDLAGSPRRPTGLCLLRGLRAKTQVAFSDDGAAQDVWGIPRQHQDRRKLLAGLRKLGMRGLTKTATSDELDAATAALVGRWALLGRWEMLGGDNGIIIPSGRFLRKAVGR